MIIMGDIENKAGIYKITCLSNGKIYIGSSVKLQNRRRGHFLELKKNQHKSPHLQNAYNKYGEQNFTFELIEYCEDNKEILLNREQYYLNLYKPYDREIGFNTCIIANSSLGVKKSKEAIQNMKQSKEKYLKNFELVSPAGEVVKGENISEFCRKHGFFTTAIGSLVNGKADTAYGWQRKIDYKEPHQFINPECKRVNVPYGQLRKFCIEHDLDPSRMLCVSKKKTKVSNGWIHADNEHFFIEVITPNGEKILINKYYLEPIVKKYNIKTEYLRRVVHGVRKHSLGWKLAEKN